MPPPLISWLRCLYLASLCPRSCEVLATASSFASVAHAASGIPGLFAASAPACLLALFWMVSLASPTWVPLLCRLGTRLQRPAANDYICPRVLCSAT